ncbi:hypothetical protein F4778DRAFT_66205 [Xylariomycetidae sp. FL2044]|nr:hypothetical protein F4778DRAFT_66205 [Xylariomycetidae sp. FL2044]
MRPHTPAIKVAHAADPSPPETPTTSSPASNRKVATNGQIPPQPKPYYHHSQRSNIRPIGGTKFSYSPGPRPEEISPRSLDSSDQESDPGAGSLPKSQSPFSDRHELRHRLQAIRKLRVATAAFTIEEMSDHSHYGDVLRPDAIQDADSDRSRSISRTRTRVEMDPAWIENFNPFNGSDDESDDDFTRGKQELREARRLRRMKSGSISKRTVSERDSGSDREDLMPYYEGNETGPNTRRMRRKVGDRSSIQFNGPLPDRIEELKEPNSDDEIILDDAEIFARELPYWKLMDVDSE